MSAGAQSGSSVRTTLINILCNTANSVKEMKDLGSQIASVTAAYLSLKHVLGNMIKAYDEVDAVVRRSTDMYSRNNIVMTHAIDTYAGLSTGLTGAVSVFQQLIKTQGMTEESMVRLAVQARELSFTMNRSVEDIAKSMRTLKVNLGLTNQELKNMMDLMGTMHAKFGIEAETFNQFSSIGGSLAKAFGGTAENAGILAAAFENATGSAQNASAFFNKFMNNVQTLGSTFAGLDYRITEASRTMLTDPVKAMGLLSAAVQDMDASTRRYMITIGAFNPIELQWLENLANERKAVEDAIAARERLKNGTETFGDVYNRVIGGVGTQLKELADNVKELGRGFATYLAPAFAMVLKTFNMFLSVLNEIPAPIKGLIGLIGGLVLSYMALGKMITFIVGMSPKILGFFGVQVTASTAASIGIRGIASAAWSAVPALGAMLVAAAPWIALAAAVAVAVMGLVKVLGGWNNIVKSLESSWKSFTKGFDKGFGKALEQFQVVFRAFEQLFSYTEQGKYEVGTYGDYFEKFGEIAGKTLSYIADRVAEVSMLFILVGAVIQDLVAMAAWAFRNYKKEILAFMFPIITLVIDTVKAVDKYLGGFLSKMFNGILTTITNALSKAKELYNKFLEWVGLGKEAPQEKPDSDNVRLNRLRAAKDIAAANERQAQSFKDLATSIESVETKQNNLADRTANIDMEVTEKRNVQVVPAQTLMSAPLRAAVLSSTAPISDTSSYQDIVVPSHTSGGQPSPTPTQVNIVLDGYILGQALLDIQRKNGVLSYHDISGPLHGI